MENYKLIDLGLPSGTLWMDRNVGADSPEDAGLYFAWSETQGYTADEVKKDKVKQFSWKDYKYCKGKRDRITKYNSTDGLTTLETKDDAVYQYTKGKCCMPTKAQIEEMLKDTTYIWTTQNTVNGGLFTSKTNGNSIFVPANGYCFIDSVFSANSYGGLWGVSLNENDIDTHYAWGLGFDSGNNRLGYNGRCIGLSVRGVMIK